MATSALPTTALVIVISMPHLLFVRSVRVAINLTVSLCVWSRIARSPTWIFHAGVVSQGILCSQRGCASRLNARQASSSQMDSVGQPTARPTTPPPQGAQSVCPVSPSKDTSAFQQTAWPTPLQLTSASNAHPVTLSQQSTAKSCALSSSQSSAHLVTTT